MWHISRPKNRIACFCCKSFLTYFEKELSFDNVPEFILIIVEMKRGATFFLRVLSNTYTSPLVSFVETFVKKVSPSKREIGLSKRSLPAFTIIPLSTLFMCCLAKRLIGVTRKLIAVKQVFMNELRFIYICLGQ